MSLYYVTPRGQEFNPSSDEKFRTFPEAKDRAEEIWANDGKHSHIMKVETVWVTTTMADLMREGAKLRGEKYII